MTTPTAPVTLHLFMYQVGFGDCFLLRFAYPIPFRPRHVLIDFGTTALPADSASGHLKRIAFDIAMKCGGRLDAVVATHRHADHISGFARADDGDGPGDVIRALTPEVVVQPWTEDLALAVDALGPSASQRFSQALTHMHAVAESVVAMVDAASPARLGQAVIDQLRFLGEDNLKNRRAVENLATMGTRNAYVFHGSPAGLEAVLPGVTVHVLGPPTLEQTQSIRKQRASDPAEFWQFRLHQLQRGGGLPKGKAEPAFPQYVAERGSKLPMSARWLAGRVREAQAAQLLSLVRALDKQMNNTSVILLFEAGSKKLLFPGDAQIENWAYALEQEGCRELLADVDLYKVGHHGSRNATPRSMWEGFSKKKAAAKECCGDGDRLHTVLSTKAGKHGFVKDSTEVPRTSLLRELDAHSHLHSTEALGDGLLCDEIVMTL